MARRVHGDLVSEYQFLKKKVKKMILKAQDLGPLQKPRVIKKIANIIKRMSIIEDDCKAMDLPHPDAFDNKDEPSLSQMKDMIFGGPKIRSVISPDGRLYGRDKPQNIDSQVSDKILVKLKPDGTLYDKNGAFKDTEGQIQKMVSRSNPDGSLFETPALEGSILPRRAGDN
mgnify:CR=1 FL=1